MRPCHTGRVNYEIPPRLLRRMVGHARLEVAGFADVAQHRRPLAGPMSVAARPPAGSARVEQALDDAAPANHQPSTHTTDDGVARHSSGVEAQQYGTRRFGSRSTRSGADLRTRAWSL